MKKAYLKELQSKLLGSVTDSPEVLNYFATDGSVITMTPEAVVYPQNTADVRKTLQYLAERAHAGKHIGLIPRGRGTDQGGGAVGDGIQLVFPAHMNRILKLDKDTITVQPGINYRTLQQTLHTHGRFLPPYPASIDYCTVGGAVANNASGEKSLKYGSTRQFVKKLKVVLSDGSMIETGRISARELNRRKGQTDLEGDIYRKLDSIILDHEALITKKQPKTTKNTAGYELDRVRGTDGSFDLTEIMIGSQGTLGVITEITLKTLPWNPRKTLVVGFFDNIKGAVDTIHRLVPLGASSMEFVDYYLLQYLRQTRPQELEDLVPEELPQITLLVEFDDFSQLSQTIKSRRATRIMSKVASSVRTATDPVEQEALWKIRRSAAAVMSLESGTRKALPFIEDGIVPLARFGELIEKTYHLLRAHELEIALWGHAGDGHLHLQPFLDLSKKKDVDTLFALAGEFNDLVLSLGGSTSGEHGDGKIRAPYLERMYGRELYDLMHDAKRAFDPENILNPLTKFDVDEVVVRQHLRKSYSLDHLADHLPYM